jgi:hypothetical protein
MNVVFLKFEINCKPTKREISLSPRLSIHRNFSGLFHPPEFVSRPIFLLSLYILRNFGVGRYTVLCISCAENYWGKKLDLKHRDVSRLERILHSK